jgi:hypothetical protein
MMVEAAGRARSGCRGKPAISARFSQARRRDPMPLRRGLAVTETTNLEINLAPL